MQMSHSKTIIYIITNCYRRWFYNNQGERKGTIKFKTTSLSSLQNGSGIIFEGKFYKFDLN